MATLPVVNAFDRRAGIISAVIAMVALLIIILFMKYEQADPPPEDIPIKLAEPMDVTEIENFVIAGGGGGGTPDEAPQSDPHQIEEVITTTTSDHQVNSGAGHITNSPTDNGPSGDDTPNHFGGGGDDGSGGGSGGGFGPDSGPGQNGNGGGSGGAGRKVIRDVSFDLDYDHVVKFTFKVTINAKGNVLSATIVKGSTTTTDQVLINKVRTAVMNQVKYSPAPGASAVVKLYSFNLQPN